MRPLSDRLSGRCPALFPPITWARHRQSHCLKAVLYLNTRVQSTHFSTVHIGLPPNTTEMMPRHCQTPLVKSDYFFFFFLTWLFNIIHADPPFLRFGIYNIQKEATVSMKSHHLYQFHGLKTVLAESCRWWRIIKKKNYVLSYYNRDLVEGGGCRMLQSIIKTLKQPCILFRSRIY